MSEVPIRQRVADLYGDDIDRAHPLIGELLALADERDRLRAVVIDALGYGADYLVAALCTSRTVDAQFAREFADRIEEMAKDVTGVTEYEKGSLDRVGDALRDARETLGQLDGSEASDG